MQYYNHSLLSYNHSQVIHSLPWEANSGSYFSRTIFEPLPKETTKYHCVSLSLSILHAHFRMIIYKNYICRQTVRRVAVLTCKQEQHSNCEGGCQTKVFLLQCNLSTDLLVFIKLKFLRILNFSQSFQEQVMTCSSCNYAIWERKKTGYSCTWIYFNIYFCITYFIWFMTSYTMRRIFGPSKVRRSPKLRGLRRSPELFARDNDFRVTVELLRYFGFLY